MLVGAGTIDGRKDLAGGRLASQRITAATAAGTKCFTSLCYTADGACLLAGGSSKYGPEVVMMLDPVFLLCDPVGVPRYSFG